MKQKKKYHIVLHDDSLSLCGKHEQGNRAYPMLYEQRDVLPDTLEEAYLVFFATCKTCLKLLYNERGGASLI